MLRAEEKLFKSPACISGEWVIGLDVHFYNRKNSKFKQELDKKYVIIEMY